MLRRQDSCGQPVGVVIRQDGHPGLGDNWSCIRGVAHEVHGAAALRGPVLQCLRLRVKARIERQQRGVNIDHPVVPACDEGGSEQPHEPRQTDEIHLMPVQLGLHRPVESITRSKGRVIQRDCGDFRLATVAQAWRIRPV